MSNLQKRLKTRYGSWAVVTGASSGIGHEIALILAEAGVNLVLVARRQADLRQMAKALSDRYGIEVRLVVQDLAMETSVETLVAQTHDLDVGLLVAAAGFGTSGAFLNSQLEQEIEMLNVNCRSLLGLTWHFSQRFAKQRRGGIVLMSSIVGFQGMPFAANYAATKAYVQTLAEALSVELAPMGVDVIASAPGPTNSGFGDRAGMKMGKVLSAGEVLGHMGLHRNVIHPKFGNFISLGAVLMEAEVTDYNYPIDYNPCIDCKLCVVACPVGAIASDGHFNFSACYTHNYRELMGGFTDWAETLAESKSALDYREKFTAVESASMWQSLSFKANYKAAYCMAACPAGEDVITPFLSDRKGFVREVVKPLQDKTETIYVIPGSDAETYVGVAEKVIKKQFLGLTSYSSMNRDSFMLSIASQKIIFNYVRLGKRSIFEK